jgi:hypothetical protein
LLHLSGGILSPKFAYRFPARMDLRTPAPVGSSYHLLEFACSPVCSLPVCSLHKNTVSLYKYTTRFKTRQEKAVFKQSIPAKKLLGRGIFSQEILHGKGCGREEAGVAAV